MSSNQAKFPKTEIVEKLVSGNGIRCLILNIGGEEFVAHVHGLKPIIRDAGKVSMSRDGKRREKKTNTIGAYKQAVLTVTWKGNEIQCGAWAGQPAESRSKADAVVVDDGIPW